MENKSVRERIMDYVYSNLSKVFMLGLFAPGFLCFLLYYGHIRYIPQVDLMTLSSVVIFISLISTVITIFVLISLVGSGATWIWMVNACKSLKQHLNAKHSEEIEHYKIFTRRVLLYYVAPVTVYGAALLFFIYDLVLPGIAVPIPYLAFLGFRILTSKENNKFATFFLILVFSVIAFIMIATPIVFVILLLIDGNPNFTGSKSYIAFILFIVLLLEINTLVILNPKEWKPLYGLPVAAVSTFLVLLALFDAHSAIPLRVMKINKIGNFEPEIVLLRREGCEILASFGFEVKLMPDATQCAVQNLKIWSTIGQEWYLQFKNSKVKFVLPREYVISWNLADS